MNSSYDPHDGRAGSLVTQGLGDALGFLVEGHSPDVCEAYAAEVFAGVDPPKFRRGPFDFGQYSDDTQLARELALSLGSTAGRPFAPQDFAARVGKLFAEDTIVGRGRATEAAANRILAGVAWDQAGEPAPSAGNGAAMRAGPVGFLQLSHEQTVRTADDAARVTHLDMRSRAAAVLVALVVRDAIGNGPADCSPSWCDGLARAVEAQDAELAAGIRNMPEWLDDDPVSVDREIAHWGKVPQGTSHQFERWHGISPFATPSVLYALYAYLVTPDDPEHVLRTAIAVGGDVDTVAAMAGAMVGAAVGLGGLTSRLCARRGVTHSVEQTTSPCSRTIATGIPNSSHSHRIS